MMKEVLEGGGFFREPPYKGLTVGRVLGNREHLDGSRIWASARQTLGRPWWSRDGLTGKIKNWRDVVQIRRGVKDSEERRSW